MLTGSIPSRLRDERSSTGREEEAWKAESQEDASVGEEMIESDSSHVQTGLGVVVCSLLHSGRLSVCHHACVCVCVCDIVECHWAVPDVQLSCERSCTFDARVRTVSYLPR